MVGTLLGIWKIEAHSGERILATESHREHRDETNRLVFFSVNSVVSVAALDPLFQQSGA
jgi:hypothetical protein